MPVDMFRMALMMKLAEDGLDGGVAARVALAVHPLDDAPVPGRAFEKAVRKRSRQVARATRRASEAEQDRVATEALRYYKKLAADHGEAHYIARYDKALHVEEGV